MALSMHDTLEACLARNPAAARIFDSLGIDYCCGGSRTLGQACAAAGLDPAMVADLLAGPAGESKEGEPAATLDPAALAEHIEKLHHALLREELPALEALADKVARVHGSADPRLVEVRDLFRALSEDLVLHLEKEEKVLFPAIRKLQAEGTLGNFHCGYLGNPIAVMEAEHAEAAEVLERLRFLTGNYAPPEWACPTYRALLERLQALDEDLREHVRKEEALLFPLALELERARSR